MLSVLNHPDLIYDWFTTVLLSFHAEHGLVIYQKWALSTAGVKEVTPGMLRGSTLLLDVYYLMYMCAFINTLYIFRRWRKDGYLKIRPHVGYDALIFAIIGTLVGAKLAYIFIYNPDFYFKDPKSIEETLQRVFLNWSGMASHGAAFGISAAMFLYWVFARAPMWHIGDAGCTAGAAGAMFIRTANFMNGELYGREDTLGLPWAMRFEVHSGKGNDLVVRGGKWFEQVRDAAGNVTPQPTTPYRLGHEFMHRAQDGTVQFFAPGSIPADLHSATLNVVTSPRHPSQLYQFILEGLLLFLFMIFMRKRLKRVGQLAGIFFIGYPLARIIGEFFRQPDVQFSTDQNPLGTVASFFSMGQLLSFGMMTVGIAMFVYFSKRGKLISEMQMWPPEKKTVKPLSDSGINLSGETAAGELSGVTTGADGEPVSRMQKKLEKYATPEERKHDDDEPRSGTSAFGRRGQ
ncbi:MAG: prolipoprotein diacylglyceryl transferase [Planctomycetes bacterium]|nr:prolipoprotein diacylglyceryl transferase [Planctomycetota bacterium]